MATVICVILLAIVVIETSVIEEHIYEIQKILEMEEEDDEEL